MRNRLAAVTADLERGRVADARGGLRLLAINLVVSAATQIGSSRLRSLDAIHLATAAMIATEIGALITCDHRVAADGNALGRSILTPF